MGNKYDPLDLDHLKSVAKIRDGLPWGYYTGITLVKKKKGN